MPYYIFTKADSERDLEPMTFDEIRACRLAERATRPEAFELLKTSYSQQTHAVVFYPSEDEYEAWRTREDRRFEDGTYIRVPWNAAQGRHYRNHFCHLSLSDPGKVAYTPDEEFGVQDRQIRTTPGRYLQKFYSDDFDAKTIAQYIADCAATTNPDALRFATSLADVRAVYRNGPSSCMGGPEDHTDEYWQERRLDGHRPIDVYSEPSELSVAYVGEISKPSQRCVVWAAKQKYGRIYGTGPLEALLQANGYRPALDWCMNGARIRRIDFNDGVIIPYIDGTAYARLDPDDRRFLILGRHADAEINCQSTCGYFGEPLDDDDESDDGIEDRYLICDRCNNSFLPENSDSASFCQGCYDDTWTCDGCDDYQWDEQFSDEHGHTYCETCYENRHTCANPDCDNKWIETLAFGYSQRRTRRVNHQTEFCAACQSRAVYFVCCDVSAYEATVCPLCASPVPPPTIGEDWIHISAVPIGAEVESSGNVFGRKTAADTIYYHSEPGNPHYPPSDVRIDASHTVRFRIVSLPSSSAEVSAHV